MAEVIAEGAWAGWIRHTDEEPDTYLSIIGPSFSRPEGPNRATVAVDTRPVHRNRMGALHGGYIAAVADHVGFAALKALGRPEQLGGVTIDLQVQFLGSGRVGPPLFAEVEILKETGRLFFVRMTFRQSEDHLVAAATATFRKVSEKT
ncbi:MAG TPA: PaaI family thioesterase [Sphingobium sp.]|uniref:PaaI family thioesterase n=1 Tax=Sphingobium sp. TaxID=1912891 RepID=UPI002ED45050